MMSFRNPVRAAALLAALSLLIGCSSKKPEEQPAELSDFRSTAKIQRVWTASVGDGAPKLRLGLTVATDGKAVFAADHDGDVVALNLANGKRLWQTKTRLPLTGGPGVGDGLVVAGASHGDIVALDAATGAQKWKTHINSEILAAPAIGNGVVLMRTVDGRVAALRVADGTQIWSAEQSVPRLTLRGTARPIVAGDLAVSGFDNGRVAALALADGASVWEASIAPPAGRTELERMVDIDSAVKAVDNDIYVVTFQGKAARIDRETGQVQWSRDISSYAGLDTDEDGFYVTTAEGTLVKIGRRTGIELWKQEVLTRRRLSPPAVIGNLVATADLDGYVHFFDASNGELAARIHAVGDRVRAAPLVSGGFLIVMDDEGKVAALRVDSFTPAAAKAPAAAPAEPAVAPVPAPAPDKN
jgi:outer membrane protein assembly factor BamB